MGLLDIFRKRKAPELVSPIPASPLFAVISEAMASSDVMRYWRGVFYRAVELRAGAIAEALSSARVERRLSQADYEMVSGDHPWVRLLNRPNPRISAYRFWWWVSISRDLYGRVCCVVERDALGVPVALWPIEPSWGTIEPRFDPSGSIAEYVYRKRSGGELQVFPAADVIDLSCWSPEDSRKVVSLIDRMLYELQSDMYQHMYRARILQNGGIAPVYIKLEHMVSSAVLERIKEEFQRNYVGIANITRIPVLSAATIEPITSTAREMELVSGIEVLRGIIEEVAGIPGGLLRGDANRANVEGARAIFLQNTIMPLARLLAEQLTVELEEAFGADSGQLRIRPIDIVPVDGLTKARQRQIEVMIGIKSPNELRKEDGLPPYEGGDRYFMAANLIDITTDPAQYPQSDSGNGPQVVGERLIRLAQRSIVASMQREAENELTELILRQIQELRDVIFDRLERRSLEDVSVQEFWGLVVWITGLSEVLARFVEELLIKTLELTAQAFRLAADLLELIASEMPREQAEGAAHNLTRLSRYGYENAQEEISKLIAQAVSENWTREKLKQELTDLFERLEKERSRVWASSLATAALNAGQYAAFVLAGVDKVRWVAVMDDRTRNAHRLAHGQVRRIGEPFFVGGEYLMFPGDTSLGASAANIANCRCWLEEGGS